MSEEQPTDWRPLSHVIRLIQTEIEKSNTQMAHEAEGPIAFAVRDCELKLAGYFQVRADEAGIDVVLPRPLDPALLNKLEAEAKADDRLELSASAKATHLLVDDAKAKISTLTLNLKPVPKLS